MPQGVEHNQQQGASVRVCVRIPLMPQGVEVGPDIKEVWNINFLSEDSASITASATCGYSV